MRLLLKTHSIEVEVTPALVVWGPGASGIAAGSCGDVLVVRGSDRGGWPIRLPSGRRQLDDAMIASIGAALAAFVERGKRFQRTRARRGAA